MAPKSKKSAAQVRAGKAFAAAGRAKQKSVRAAAIAKTGKPPPRTKAQKAATAKFAAAGRAAQAARRAGKTPVAKKKAAAPLNPQAALDLAAEDPTQSPVSLHLLPVCGPVALAEHLYASAGFAAPDEEIIALANQSGPLTLADLLECVSAEGFAGARLISFQRCDEEHAVPGLLCGVQLRTGYHAVLAHPGGMLTWGTVLPWEAAPAEAWHLEWAA